MKTVTDVLAAFEVAALNAGLARNTRKTYAATIYEFTTMLKAGRIAGPQDYFNFLASVKKLSPNSVHHALNPLKFLYEKVLLKEFGTDYEIPKRNRCKPMRSVLSMSEILRMMETMELYLHTSGGNTVRSPLDTAAERNIIPLRKFA
jgi:site-specific recombinase XerD